MVDYIRDCANAVFEKIGYGLEPQVYIDAMKIALQLEEQMIEENRSWPITYEGFSIGHSIHADLVVNQEVVVLVRSDEDDFEWDAPDMKRLLKFSGIHHGVIINFGSNKLDISEIRMDDSYHIKRG